ncbi:hypothetical protein [Bradyrhizobium sp.]
MNQDGGSMTSQTFSRNLETRLRGPADNQDRNINYQVLRALALPRAKRTRFLRVEGCATDTLGCTGDDTDTLGCAGDDNGTILLVLRLKDCNAEKRWPIPRLAGKQHLSDRATKSGPTGFYLSYGSVVSRRATSAATDRMHDEMAA